MSQLLNNFTEQVIAQNRVNNYSQTTITTNKQTDEQIND